MAGTSTRTIGMAIAGLAVVLVGAFVWQRNASPATPMAEDVFKDVQELRGIPVDEFMGTMGFFSASLGMNCTDCHGEESGGSWERYVDDTPRKRMTRVMMRMVRTINEGNFEKKDLVTCFTCHRGNPRPQVMPSINALYASPADDEPGAPIQAAPGQPSPESILDKHLAAVGGAAAAGALKTLAITATYQGFDDPDTIPAEVTLTAEGQRRSVVHGALGDTRIVLDGQRAWLAAPSVDRPTPLQEYTGSELNGLKLENLPFFPAQLKGALSNLRTGFPAIIKDRDVMVVQGEMAGGGTATLCFDAETGLLVRMVRFGPSPVGPLVSRVDYDEYREVNGVKIPSKWAVIWLSGRGRYVATDVKVNGPVDSGLFEQPEPSTAPNQQSDATLGRDRAAGRGARLPI